MHEAGLHQLAWRHPQSAHLSGRLAKPLNAPGRLPRGTGAIEAGRGHPPIPGNKQGLLVNSRQANSCCHVTDWRCSSLRQCDNTSKLAARGAGLRLPALECAEVEVPSSPANCGLRRSAPWRGPKTAPTAPLLFHLGGMGKISLPKAQRAPHPAQASGRDQLRQRLQADAPARAWLWAASPSCAIRAIHPVGITTTGFELLRRHQQLIPISATRTQWLSAPWPAPDRAGEPMAPHPGSKPHSRSELLPSRAAAQGIPSSSSSWLPACCQRCCSSRRLSNKTTGAREPWLGAPAQLIHTKTPITSGVMR